MTEKRKNTIFVSDCGGFIAIRIPGPVYPAFDVWRHDGSEMWVGNRYVKVPGTKGYNPQSLYMKEFAKSTKMVGSWTNRGHEKRNGEWVEGFELSLYDLETKESLSVKFHTTLSSLAPQYGKRKLRKCGEEDD